jgi:hypothetical protein
VQSANMGHSMHGQDPALFAKIVTDWAQRILR